MLYYPIISYQKTESPFQYVISLFHLLHPNNEKTLSNRSYFINSLFTQILQMNASITRRGSFLHDYKPLWKLLLSFFSCSFFIELLGERASQHTGVSTINVSTPCNLARVISSSFPPMIHMVLFVFLVLVSSECSSSLLFSSFVPWQRHV